VAGPPAPEGDTARSGRVVDADGAAVPGALVTIVESTVPMPEIALVCDNGGRFTVRLPPGRFVLRAHGAGGSGDAAVESPADDEIVIAIAR
jgi:carboxypeptidase family protein